MLVFKPKVTPEPGPILYHLNRHLLVPSERQCEDYLPTPIFGLHTHFVAWYLPVLGRMSVGHESKG